MRKIHHLLLFALLNTMLLSAQPFEIRAVSDGNNALSVQLRSTAVAPIGTTNRVTDLVFGVKWLKTCGNNLDLTTLTNSGFNIVTSGLRGTNGVYYYRAFGADPIGFSIPSNWAKDQWVPILRVTTNQLGGNSCGFEICDLGFDAALSDQTGPNFAVDFVDYTPTINGLANVTLPLTLLDFTAKADKQAAVLHWTTADERNLSHFEVEKSTDGKAWTKIGQVKAAHTEGYVFTDDKAFSAATLVFYRLKMRNNDGTFTYSKVVNVERGKGLFVSIFPNPVQNELNIDIHSEAKKIDVEVFDILGRSIFKQNTEGSNLLTINTLKWQSGVYMLMVTDGAKFFQQKIIKQ